MCILTSFYNTNDEIVFLGVSDRQRFPPTPKTKAVVTSALPVVAHSTVITPREVVVVSLENLGNLVKRRKRKY